ncbi:ROK family transcriptional regulator [Arthrobacter agilis]|jgi:predicted NBD/HSP70 family sugar kinase|uniref:ROK family transcriptional regulator n=1 Tax=Arthrobacter agilis TaxID=37921 RepID=UPI00278AA825|nr:ROK family transcriptional regulator [Arthrobacter agilis]MDQ0735885.1 putative NBD/HSP70 family sugar kinase [Arthrobacter agilis]
MGDFNQTVVLDAIRRSPTGLSRVELATISGLSAQTLSNIARRLLEQELVIESGKVQNGRGKPRTVLALNPSARFAVGVHLDPAVITFVILDLSGRVVAHSTRRTPLTPDADVVIQEMGDAVAALLAEAGVDPERVLGVGVASPGPIDPVRGIVVDPPYLLGWDRVPLRESLSAATGFPVVLEKDVAATAVAEIWGSHSDSPENFIFVYLGTGVGMGLVYSGAVLRGTSQNAGEVGHIVVDPTGPDCFCGLRGCVAVTCMPRNLVEEAIRAGVHPEGVNRADPGAVEAAFLRLCAEARGGDAAAGAIIDRSARRIAKAVSVLTNALDVDRVIFGGPYWPALSEAYLDLVPRALRGLTVAPHTADIRVEGTAFGTDVGAVGAACTVFDKAISPDTRRLLLEH